MDFEELQQKVLDLLLVVKSIDDDVRRLSNTIRSMADDLYQMDQRISRKADRQP